MEPELTRIEPSRGWPSLGLLSLWRHRELLFILARRDVTVRYKQTILGAVWVVIQPLVAAIIFAVIFGRLAKLPSDGVPYLLFAFTSLVAWNFFAGTISRAGNCLVGNAGLITKIYFPRLIIPFSSALALLVDLAVALAVAFLMTSVYRVPPTWHILTLPLFLGIAGCAALGVSLWLASLNVYYRDVAYVIPFLVQAWMYATPVVFSTSLVPEHWRTLYALNPLVAAIEGTRWAILGQSSITLEMLLSSVAVTSVVLVTGLLFFRRVERTFADVI